jgi:hypothetical protein
VARNESNTCRNALSILRDASLPEKLYAEHESDILGPVEANFDEVCRQVFAWVRIVTRGRRDPSAKANIAHEALRKYDEKLKPQLKQILEVAGRESLITRRAFESVAAQLNEVATAFRAIGDLKQGLSAIGSAYALAPPGSATLLLVEESLRSMGRGESIRARTEGEYFAALARELLPSPPPRELFTEYIKAESRSNRESESFGYYWLISVMCMCGVLTVFNLGNRKPNYRDSFPYRGININYNYRVPVPQMTPLPPINIDTLMAPPKPTSAERRKETKAARTARRRDAKGTKKP